MEDVTGRLSTLLTQFQEATKALEALLHQGGTILHIPPRDPTFGGQGPVPVITRRWFDRANITPEALRLQFIQNQKSIRECATIFGVSAATVCNYLKKYGIKAAERGC